MSAVKKQSPGTVIYLSILAGLFVLPMWRVGYYDIGMFRDDAGIVFVYARNLIETGQIFYNFPLDRIDGFTSTTDVIFALPLYLLAPDSMFVWNFYIKALITSLTPLLVFWLFLRWELNWWIAALLAAGLASSDLLSAAFGMQLEGPLYVVGIVAFFACLFDRDRPRLYLLVLLGMLLCLTRPEAVVLVAIAFAATVLLSPDQQRRRTALYAATGVIVFLIAWYLWRISYFGYWAPNTYYAKLSGSRWQELSDGFGFVLFHFTSRPDAFLYAAFAAVVVWIGSSALRAGRSVREANFLVATLVALTMLAVRIWTGGDSYRITARLLVDFSIPALLALGLGIALLRQPLLRNVACIFAGLAVLGNGLIIARNMPDNLAAGFWRAEREVNAGLVCEREATRLVNARFPDARFAHTDFQRAKYYVPDFEVLDLSGLNNRDIAHRSDASVNVFGKHDLQYGLERRVELWKMGTGVMERTPLHEFDWPVALRSGDGLKDRMRDALDFMQANYEIFAHEYAPLTVRTNCGTYLNLLIRKDLISGDSLYLEATSR